MPMATSSGSRTSGVRRRPTQARSRERLDALVDSAAELIGLHGIDAITMTRIAENAGVALTAAYRYFPNKQAVVRELALRSFEADDVFYRSFADRDGRPLQAWIEDVVTAYCVSQRDNASRLQLRAAVHASVELAELNLEDTRNNARRVAEALAAAGAEIDRDELEARALLLLKLFDGAISAARAVSPEESDAVIQRFAGLASSFLLDPAAPITTGCDR